jgi:type II restriction/modification system DNA methylase subunit YeeA
LIDFPLKLSEKEASLFQAPFEFLKAARYEPDDPEDTRTLIEARATARDEHARLRWWEPYWPRPALRKKLASLSRYIVTPETAEYRTFVWLALPILPDKNLIIVARDDDTTFGILHSRFHEAWSLRLGTSLEDRPRYTSSTTFATFPFPVGLMPNIPAKDYANDPRAKTIAATAKRLNDLRNNWLNPLDFIRVESEVVSGYPNRILPKDAQAAVTLRDRTLTNLYNQRPQWLADAHHDLDTAVAAAYGWPSDISEDDALTKLLELNLARANVGNLELMELKDNKDED